MVHDNQHQQNTNFNQVIILHDIPNYLDTKINSNYKTLKINTFRGFMIKLNSYKGIDFYLKANFSAKTRARFRTRKNRLEQCFNITHTMYYGAISKKEYNFLFDQLEILIKKRFQQKRIVHDALFSMDSYRKIMRSMILDKKACLYVINDTGKPISISLNLTMDKTFYGFIKSYDIDYSKFSLGFTDWICQLEWCFANDFQIFDMLKGDLDYKRKLADHVYDYQNHVIYKPNKPINSIIANYVAFKINVYYKMLDTLKKWNLHLIYRKIKNHKYQKTNQKTDLETYKEIKDYPYPDTFSNINLINLDLNDSNHSFIRKIVYDFQYRYKENSNDIRLFQTLENSNTYLIIGKQEKLAIEKM